jgi:hypothetical protein
MKLRGIAVGLAWGLVACAGIAGMDDNQAADAIKEGTATAKPYLARIGYCTGVLVAPDWVLTATECVALPGYNRVAFPHAPGQPSFTTNDVRVLGTRDLAMMHLPTPVAVTPAPRGRSPLAQLAEVDIYGFSLDGRTSPNQAQAIRRQIDGPQAFDAIGGNLYATAKVTELPDRGGPWLVGDELHAITCSRAATKLKDETIPISVGCAVDDADTNRAIDLAMATDPNQPAVFAVSCGEFLAAAGKGGKDGICDNDPEPGFAGCDATSVRTNDCARCCWTEERLAAGTYKAGEFAIGRTRAGHVALIVTPDGNSLDSPRLYEAGGPGIDWATFRGAIASRFSYLPRIGTNGDGRLELFYTNALRDLKHHWEESNGGWTNEAQVLNEKDVNALAVGQNADGRLEVFFVDHNTLSSNDLYHQWQTDSGWSDPVKFELGDDSPRKVAVARNADGRLELFYTADDSDRGSIHHLWQDAPNGGWSGPGQLPGLASDLKVALAGDGLLHLFTIDGNGYIRHQWQSPGQDDGWNGGEGFVDDQRAESIHVHSGADGQLRVFFATPDAQDLRYATYVPTRSSPWRTRALPGKGTELQAISAATGPTMLFYRGTDAVVRYQWVTDVGFFAPTR